MNKNLIIVILAVLVIGGGIWLWQKTKTSQTQPQTQTQTQVTPQQANDTTTSISKDLDSIDTGANLDQQFQSIDLDINKL